MGTAQLRRLRKYHAHTILGMARFDVYAYPDSGERRLIKGIQTRVVMPLFFGSY